MNTVYSESVKAKTPYNIIHRLLLKDGTVKFVHEICRTEYDDDGTPLCSIGTIQDITELKQLEEQINTYDFEDAQETLAEIAKFLNICLEKGTNER